MCFVRFFQCKKQSFIDEFVDSASKVLVSVMILACLSFEVKD